MSERRRLKAGVEVDVDGDSVWLHVGSGAVIAFTVPRKYGGADLITEPISDIADSTFEEPAGPKVGDEVTAEWLHSEWDEGRHHVVRNPDGSAASWDEEVDGTSAVEDADGTYAKSDSGDTWPLLALHPVERWEEPESTGPSVRLNAMEDRIEALEEESGVVGERLRKLERMAHWDSPTNPNPKEVMPDAWDRDGSGTPDVAPPPGAEQDAPGGDEPSVEEVLEWLKDIESAFAASVTDAKMPRVAAHIIREQREEIEEWANLYRRTRDTLMVRDNEMAELRAEVASLTERLTITDEKVEAAYHAWSHGPSGMEAFRDALRAAGMIDPEVER